MTEPWDCDHVPVVLSTSRTGDGVVWIRPDEFAHILREVAARLAEPNTELDKLANLLDDVAAMVTQ